MFRVFLPAAGLIPETHLFAGKQGKPFYAKSRECDYQNELPFLLQ